MNLTAVRIITAVLTQGRFAGGQGQEYAQVGPNDDIHDDDDDNHRHHGDYVVGGDDRDCRHIGCIIGVEVWLIGKNTGTVSDER